MADFHQLLGVNMSSEQSNTGLKKKKEKPSISLLRVSKSTAKYVKKLLEKINKKDFGKKVSTDALVSLALGLIGQKQITFLQDGSLTNNDKFELSYRVFLKSNPGVSRDEYMGKLLAGELGESQLENAAISDSKTPQSEV